MKVAGKCLGVGPGPGKGNAVIVTVLNDIDGEPHEIDVRCWPSEKFLETTRNIRTGDRVMAEGQVKTTSWKKDKDDPRPAIRFTNFNATAILVVNSQDAATDEDIPF